MKHKLLIGGLLLTICSCKTSSMKPIHPGKKVEIANPDYGILSESYRTRSGMRPLMWRCFSVKDMEVKYRTWRGADPLGPYDVIVTMCDFEMFVKGNSISHIYHGRRGNSTKPIYSPKTRLPKLHTSNILSL